MFEWDEAKSERNRKERGIGFDVAATVFTGRFIEIEDRRRDYGERRWRAIGEADGEILAVVSTWREPADRAQPTPPPGHAR
ncbi:MAG TPA: BrnT family toxin [Alphaproteobacteria bacterium]|nr:BrnT family toxin [Alphaproteobacteria bacterium]